MKRTITAVLALFLVTTVYAASTQQVKLTFDVFESARTIAPKDASFYFSELNKRKSLEGLKYLAGGDFTLSPYAEENFLLKQEDCELVLKTCWQPVVDYGIRKIELRYKATLHFPMQNPVTFEKSLEILSGASQVVIESDGPGGARDTRPVRIYLKAEFADPVYGFSLLGGIGAKISSQKGSPFISDVIAGGPAAAAGLKFGDEITEIDGYATNRLTTDKAAGLLRGEPGTKVRLKIYKTGTKTYEEKEITRTLLEQ
jgi:hypothetical protein